MHLPVEQPALIAFEVGNVTSLYETIDSVIRIDGQVSHHLGLIFDNHSRLKTR